jgi:hypothetical protein
MKTAAGVLLAGGALALATAGGAAAATFGPASAAIAILASPGVTLSATSGTEGFSAPVAIFGTMGSLTSASGTGSVSGTLNFSDTVGAVLPDVVTNFMTFADKSGGDFTFNVSSVETIAYAHNAGVSTSVTLYLLGTAGDTHLGLGYSPTSETITVNQTGTSAFSSSASIASPPSMGTPEPAAWAMMLVGFGLSGMVIRLRARTRAASV